MSAILASSYSMHFESACSKGPVQHNHWPSLISKHSAWLHMMQSMIDLTIIQHRKTARRRETAVLHMNMHISLLLSFLACLSSLPLVCFIAL